MFRREGEIREWDLLGQALYLKVGPCFGPVVGDFLEQRYVGPDLAEHVHHPIKSISTVNSSDSFVNIPTQYPDAHVDQAKGRSCRMVLLYPPLPWRWKSAMNIGSERSDRGTMIEDVFEELNDSLDKAHEALRAQLSKLRTGRAHPGMLDGIKVDYYGSKTPINQMAAVGVPEPRMLTVKPWEKNLVQAIDKALRESNLGLNPQVDGDLIRVPVPPLSEERRRDLTKIAKKNGEDCRIAIRKSRHDAIDMLSEMKKGGDAGEDQVERAKKKAEEIVASAIKVVETLVSAKEEEILRI